MNSLKKINQIRFRRKRRARAKIFGTGEKPRLSIFRSNRYIYVQLIDDKTGKTLISASTYELSKSEKPASPKDSVDKPAAGPARFALRSMAGGQKAKKQELAGKLGELIAKKAIEKNIKKAVFDRGKYKYHGRIKAVAEAARKGGLQL
jgi:large subunit ribosomal protein L18